MIACPMVYVKILGVDTSTDMLEHLPTQEHFFYYFSTIIFVLMIE